MKITFIGAGNMSEAIISGVLKQGVFSAKDIRASDPLIERRNHMRGTYGVEIGDNNREAVEGVDIVVLAVKPQIFSSVWEDLKEAISSSTLIVSIMAGITSETIACDTNFRVIRVMPNTPSLVGRGASGIAMGKTANEDDMGIAEKIMQSVGVSVRVKEEQLHAVTALSGSGPAYIFYLIEAMMQEAIDLGLDEDAARLLCAETVGGAADLFANSKDSAKSLRNKVTSKGGTTAAAIKAFEDKDMKSIIAGAMKSAYKRSLELS